MRKISLVLAIILAVALLPGFGYQQIQASSHCDFSFPTEFSGASGATPIAGRIAQTFSTLRSAPAAASGTVVLAPAEFDAIDQLCLDGFSWVQITYTSGTTSTGASAVGLTGWALESQTFFDGIYGPGRWLTTAAPGPGPGPTPGTCEFSYPTGFPTGTGSGQINEVFSTLRTAPGAIGGTRVLAPATFDVISQGCFGGFSWLQIEYTSGTTSTGASAVGLTGWALESQTFFDGTYGPGTWLVPVAAP